MSSLELSSINTTRGADINMGMTDKKINQVLDIYEKRVKSFDPWGIGYMIPGIEDPGQRQAAKAGLVKMAEQFNHLYEMIGKIRKFLTEDRREKAFRWLGFIQGVFYSLGIYTIEELANHNRPTKDDLKEQYPGHSFEASGCAECSGPTYQDPWPDQKPCAYAKELVDAPLDEKPGN